MLSLPALFSRSVAFLGSWRGLLAAFAVGVSVGGWAGYRLGSSACDRAEVARLEKIQELKDQAYNRALTALQGYYSDRLKTEAGRVKRETIVKVVPAESDCVVPADAVGLLQAKRDGVPYAAPGTAGSAATAEGIAALQISGLVWADADLADDYHACRKQVIRLREYYGLD
ncbi:hypothetical protein [Primorskyibacter sedentarius]|uniref:hypothetical protein n=1 Tax=Primorskyibacter sedentarius TaxID=745311 RepID=UPI003EBC9E19